jgi:DNA invertase Pin-like site-specific DNA recombinase
METRRYRRGTTSGRADASPPTLVPAALYLRRSTNAELQAESLEIQEEILRKHSGTSGFSIVKVYRESASGRDAEGRDQFQQLIEDVTSGNADYEAILVRDVSRWGRFDNIDESAYYDFLCFRHGVEVVYVEESFARDAGPYAALQKSMKRVMAADFSREKSRIITHGKRRAAALGFAQALRRLSG